MTRLLFVALAVASSVAVEAQPASVSGTWAVSLNIAGNQSEQTCSLTQKDAELTGTCKGERDTVSITGKVDGKTVGWQFNTEYEGQKLTVVHNGTLESADKIAGSVEVQPMGVGGEFTATRTK